MGADLLALISVRRMPPFQPCHVPSGLIHACWLTIGKRSGHPQLRCIGSGHSGSRQRTSKRGGGGGGGGGAKKSNSNLNVDSCISHLSAVYSIYYYIFNDCMAKIGNAYTCMSFVTCRHAA